MPPPIVSKVVDEYNLDSDILRHAIFKEEPQEQPEPVCTLEDELKSPSERPSVQKMIDIGRSPPTYRKIRSRNSGLDYNPLPVSHYGYYIDELDRDK